MIPVCENCEGQRWVCENHADKAWPDVCECGPGMPCPVCNTNPGWPDMAPGHVTLWSIWTDGETVQ